MKVRAGIGTFAAAAFAALAVAGDDAKTYDIDAHEHWTAKQVVTFTDHETSDMDMKVGGKSMHAEQSVLDAVYSVRCDEADDKGEPTKRTVFVKSWKETKNGKSDESITGALVTVTGNEWKLAPGKTAGNLAGKWLDATFGKKDMGNPLAKVAPTKLKVGETWKADPKVVAEAFASELEDAPFDASKTTMELTLESAEGTPPDASGKLSFKAHLPISSMPHMPPHATLHDGAGAELTGTRTGPLTKSTMVGVSHMDFTLKVDLDMQTPNGAMTAESGGKMVKDRTAVAGGEIPEAVPPTAKAPPAAPDGGK